MSSFDDDDVDSGPGIFDSLLGRRRRPADDPLDTLRGLEGTFQLLGSILGSPTESSPEDTNVYHVLASLKKQGVPDKVLKAYERRIEEAIRLLSDLTTDLAVEVPWVEIIADFHACSEGCSSSQLHITVKTEMPETEIESQPLRDLFTNFFASLGKTPTDDAGNGVTKIVVTDGEERPTGDPGEFPLGRPKDVEGFSALYDDRTTPPVKVDDAPTDAGLSDTVNNHLSTRDDDTTQNDTGTQPPTSGSETIDPLGRMKDDPPHEDHGSL